MRYKVEFPNEKDMLGVAKLAAETWQTEAIFPYDEMLAFYKAHPYMIMVVKDENESVEGYIGFAPIREDVFNKILLGTFIERDDFTPQSCIPLHECAGQTVDWYWTSIVAKNKNKEVAAALYGAILEFGYKYKELNISVGKIAVEAYSPDGVRVSDKLGFKCIATQDELSDGFRPKVYLLDLNEKCESDTMQKLQDILNS